MASSIGGSSSQSTTDAWTNTSTVYGYGSITITAGNFYGLQSWGRVWIGGQNYDIAGPTSMSQGSSWSWSAGRTFGHDQNGYRGPVDVSVEFWVDGTSLHANSTGAGTQGAIDYDRRPGTPSFASVTRSGTSYSVSINTVGSPAGTPTYYIQRSQNGGGWGDTRTGTSATFSGLPAGSSQQFLVYATNSDGTGGTGYSGTYSVPNVPSSPSSVNLTTSGTSLTVTVGASASNGGDSGNPTYKIRYSTNGGSTWSSFTSVTAATPQTFTNLAPGLTYTVEAYATNTVGDSAPATASTLLVVGGKLHNGTSWATNTIARFYDFKTNTYRDLSIAKFHNGTDWVNLT